MVEVIQINTPGEFTLEELKKLVQCIREIEQNDRMRDVKLFMNLPDKTMKQHEEILDSIEPGLRYMAILKDGIRP